MIEEEVDSVMQAFGRALFDKGQTVADPVNFDFLKSGEAYNDFSEIQEGVENVTIDITRALIVVSLAVLVIVLLAVSFSILVGGKRALEEGKRRILQAFIGLLLVILAADIVFGIAMLFK